MLIAELSLFFPCAHSSSPNRLCPCVLATLDAHGLLAIYSKMFIGGLNWDTTDGTYSTYYTSSYTVVLK